MAETRKFYRLVAQVEEVLEYNSNVNKQYSGVLTRSIMSFTEDASNLDQLCERCTKLRAYPKLFELVEEYKEKLEGDES